MNDQRIDEEYARAQRRPHHNGKALPNPRTELAFGDGEIVAIADLPTENKLMAALILNPGWIHAGGSRGSRGGSFSGREVRPLSGEGSVVAAEIHDQLSAADAVDPSAPDSGTPPTRD